MIGLQKDTRLCNGKVALHHDSARCTARPRRVEPLVPQHCRAVAVPQLHSPLGHRVCRKERSPGKVADAPHFESPLGARYSSACDAGPRISPAVEIHP